MAIVNVPFAKSAVGGQTASVDIPKPRTAGTLVGMENLGAATAKSLATTHPNQMLPTPPNSISPSLPPQNFSARGYVGAGGARPPTPQALDSEPLELRHRVDQGQREEREPAVRRPEASGSVQRDLDATGAISPALLATYHLPDILLAHGPLAIRHIMNHLTISVPGFSRILPARARRLVVGALEGRVGQGSEGDGAVAETGGGGGINGDVIFEKVGWGRWDARLQGQPPRRVRRDGFGSAPGNGSRLDREVSPAASAMSASSFSRAGLPSKARRQDDGVRRRHPDGTVAGASWTEGSAAFSHRDDDYYYDGDNGGVGYSTEEHEADRMSLDRVLDPSLAPSSSGVDPDNDAADPDVEREEDITDDEDWAGIGAAALRQASCSAASSSFPKHRTAGHYRIRRPLRRPSPSPPASSSHRNLSRHHVPRHRLMSSSHRSTHHPPLPLTRADPNLSLASSRGLASNSQEREAIEALVRLSNV